MVITLDILSAILYGVLQGLTEFLPVSSSGHLALAQAFFGVEDMAEKYFTFDILLHFGTLLAVIIVYFRDIVAILMALGRAICGLFSKRRQSAFDEDRKIALMLIVATIPMFLIVPVKDVVSSLYTNTLFIGCALLVTGIMLFLADKISSHTGKSALQASYKGALLVGIFQAIAVLPGISRSGATISGGLLCGFSREFAVKFSFLLSIPTILGANILELKDVTAMSSAEILPCVLGVLAALISGLIAISFIKFLAKHKNFTIFTVYCLVVGAASIAATFIWG